jgi:hypothetical protein
MGYNGYFFELEEENDEWKKHQYMH